MSCPACLLTQKVMNNFWGTDQNCAHFDIMVFMFSPFTQSPNAIAEILPSGSATRNMSRR